MIFHNNWDKILNSEINSDYFKILETQILKYRQSKNIYPANDNVFRALLLTDYPDVKVVILGQDPYYNPNQANGLSFSVPNGEKLPPSLKNIFKELEIDLGIKNINGDLSPWAKQGVLLLNAILTVEENKPGSHKMLGWEKFTNKIIIELNKHQEPIVFILWGAYAMKKKVLIAKHHHVISSSHPSPLSAYKGFIGSKPFSKCNALLDSPINWQT